MRCTICLVAFLSFLPSRAGAQSILDWWQRSQYQLVVDAVANDPNADLNYVYVAADSLRRLNRNQEAYDQYARLAANGSHPWVYIGWSGGWESLGNLENARIAGQWAVDSAPGWVLPELHLGRIENRMGLHAQGAARLDWVISQIPWASWPYWHSAAAHLSQGGSYHNDLGYQRLAQFVRMVNPVCPHPDVWEVSLSLCEQYGASDCGIPLNERVYCP